jgi:hypothetical protein
MPRLTLRRPVALRMALAGALAVLVGSLMAAVPASAAPLPDPVVVKASDAYIKSQCGFRASSANLAAGTVRGRLTAKANWSSLAGFRDLTAVSVECVLTDSSFTQVADVRKFVFAKSVYASKLVTVPASSSYHVCITASYSLRNFNSGRVYNCV